MNKGELIKKVSQESGLSYVAAKRAVDAALRTIKEELYVGNSVKIAGFGVFKSKNRNQREAVNLNTGERMNVPPRRLPVFDPSPILKDYISGGEEVE